MLSLLASNPLYFLLFAAALVIAITIHEFAHAWTANRLGDPTPRLQGRITLNPLRHLDPVGTLAMVLTGFGWGKAVEFDPYNLKNPRRDTAIIAVAGPVSNMILAILLSLAIHLLPLPQLFQVFAVVLIGLNVSLAIFNLLPIHPLDGGKILVGILPKETAMEWDRINHQFGIFILLALLLPLGNTQSPASYLIQPIIRMIQNILIP